MVADMHLSHISWVGFFLAKCRPNSQETYGEKAMVADGQTCVLKIGVIKNVPIFKTWRLIASQSMGTFNVFLHF